MPMTPATLDAPSTDLREEPVSNRYRRYVILLLFLTAALNHLDRNILSILMDSIRHDLKLSDTEIGLLTGMAFALLYTTMSIPLGLLADRYSRKTILSAALAIWSAMTISCGIASSYFALLLSRAGVGAGEAAGIPSTASLVGDYFKPGERASANAWIGVGSSLGLALGLGLGGVVNHYWGWRWAFVIAGAPGLVLALVMALTLREPPRGTTEAKRSFQATPKVFESIRQLLRNMSLLHLIIGAALGNIANSVVTWLPTYYIRAYGIGTAQLGLWMTLFQAVGASLGVLAAGKLADRLHTRDPRWHAWLIAISSLATFPLFLGVLLAPSLAWSFILLGPALAFKFAYLGPYNASLIGLSGPQNRAAGAALAMFIVQLTGMGIGHALIGIISDLYGGNSADSLRASLLTITPILLWSAFHSYKAAAGLKTPKTSV